MSDEQAIMVTLDRLGVQLADAGRRRRQRRNRCSLLVGAPLLAVAIAASLAIGGVSPWPAGSSLESDHGTPVLITQGDTSHPFDPTNANDAAALRSARAALASSTGDSSFAPRPWTPPPDATEVAWGICTQFSGALVSCGAGDFYLVAVQDGRWVPAGDCVSTASIRSCSTPYALAIDTTDPNHPRLVRLR